MRTAPSATPLVSSRARESLGERISLFEHCEDALRVRELGVADVVVRGHVPGRVELLGKHVDYAGGRSIVCAIDRGIVFAASARRDNVVRAIDAASSESREAPLDAACSVPTADWAIYVATVARRVARDFPAARTGVDLVFASDLPPASGLSSSSALLISTFLAIAQVNAWFNDSGFGTALSNSPLTLLADYLAAVESGRPFEELHGGIGVGTLGGSQDHAAILCCGRDMLSRFAFLPTRHLGDSALSERLTLAVAFSGVHAEKARNAREQYNQAAQAAAEIVRIFRERTGDSAPRSLGDLLAAGAGTLADTRDAIRGRPDLLRRLEHFVEESGDIHDSAAAALTGQDWEHFGEVVARSQRASEALLGNQVAETIELVHAARYNGALAASAFGAGFGGSVWALVHATEAPHFLERWRTAHAARFPDVAPRATFFASRPAAAAHYIA